MRDFAHANLLVRVEHAGEPNGDHALGAVRPAKLGQRRFQGDRLPAAPGADQKNRVVPTPGHRVAQNLNQVRLVRAELGAKIQRGRARGGVAVSGQEPTPQQATRGVASAPIDDDDPFRRGGRGRGGGGEGGGGDDDPGGGGRRGRRRGRRRRRRSARGRPSKRRRERSRGTREIVASVDVSVDHSVAFSVDVSVVSSVNSSVASSVVNSSVVLGLRRRRRLRALRRLGVPSLSGFRSLGSRSLRVLRARPPRRSYVSPRPLGGVRGRRVPGDVVGGTPFRSASLFVASRARRLRILRLPLALALVRLVVSSGGVLNHLRSHRLGDPRGSVEPSPARAHEHLPPLPRRARPLDAPLVAHGRARLGENLRGEVQAGALRRRVGARRRRGGRGRRLRGHHELRRGARVVVVVVVG